MDNFKPSLQCLYHLISFVLVEFVYGVVASHYEFPVLKINHFSFDFSCNWVPIGPYFHLMKEAICVVVI